MTDARYPSRWLLDKRIVGLSDSAHRLFVVALAYSAENRTDGRIDKGDLLVMHVDADRIGELVESGLVAEESPDCWRITVYESTQTSASQLDGLDHKRELDRQRKANERARKAGVTEPFPRGDVT